MNDNEDKAVVRKDPNAVTKWDAPLDLNHLSVTQMRFMGQAMADSGMFPDIQKDAAKAMVKIMAGQEIGVTPFQAMSNINIIQGKASLGANLMAAKVKGSGKYDYRADVSSDRCTITMMQQGNLRGDFEEIGKFTFTLEDAKRQGLAGKDNWVKFPSNMLFARAISTAVRMFAPDVFNGNLVYDPDELGAVTSETGEVVSGTDSSSDLTDALAAINAAKDEDELTDVVTNLSADLQKNTVEAAKLKFTSFNEPEAA